MARRGALQALAERSGSDSDECMFDQTNLLQRRRMDITRLRRSSATMSGHRLTVARTVNLCLSFFALGLCFVMPTATITGLQYRTNTSEDGIGNIYRARYGGYIVGCFAGGFLFNCYNRQFLLFLALLATAIGVLVMPFCRFLATLMACTCVTGVTMGLLDTGGNVWLLDLWGRKSAPFMQTMHFCFGLGALVAPLVAQPFVGAYNQIGASGHSFNGSDNRLPPMSFGLPRNPYGQRVIRRDLAQIAHNISTPPPILANVTLSKTPSMGTPDTSASTAAPSSKTSPLTTTVPKKPLFANGKDQLGRWDRPEVHVLSATSASVTGNLKANSTTSTTTTTTTSASVSTTDKNHSKAGSSSRPPAINTPVTVIASETVLGAAAKDSTASATTMTSTGAVARASSPTPSTVPRTGTTAATASAKNCSHCSTTSDKSNVAISNGISSTSESEVIPAITTTTPTTTVSPPSSLTTPLHEVVMKSHRRVLPPDETPSSSDPLKVSHEPGTAGEANESTTKATSSTVPTQGTVKVSTAVPPPEVSHPRTTIKAHHSAKKVLPDGAERVSWMEATRKRIQESGKFEIAYGILAAYVLVVSVVFLAFLCMNPREGRSKQQEEEELDDSHVAQASRMRIPLIVLMCSFFFLYMGIEVAVGETLKSLFKRGALVTRVITGEQLVYIFWGSFALARGVSIFISMKASYRSMLIGDLLLCLSAALTLVLGAQQPVLLIAGVIVLATGMASIIPTLFIWLERCTQVTNRLSALLILSAAAGEMIIPELVSAFIRNSTPMALMYVILGVILLCSVNLVALCYVTSVRGEKYLAKPDRSLYQLASLDDDIEHWNQGNGKNGQQPDGAVVKRNKNNSFFYNRLNSLDS